MDEPKPLSKGDPCPACGGTLDPVRVATAAEWAGAADRENPRALPVGIDTMNPTDVAVRGALFRCGRCGYAARFGAS